MFCFRVRSCRVQIHFSIFVLLASLALFSDVRHGLFLLFSILLHEAAHLGMMFYLNRSPDLVMISGLGLRIQLPYSGRLSYGESIRISLAGPICNLLIGAVSLLFGEIDCAMISFAIGLVHLLPIEPLDGGLALRAFFAQRAGEEKAGRLMLVLSVAFLFPMLVVGFMILLQSRHNFSLLLLSVYLMLYLVIKRDLFIN